jgi:hypothetical protein
VRGLGLPDERDFGIAGCKMQKVNIVRIVMFDCFLRSALYTKQKGLSGLWASNIDKVQHVELATLALLTHGGSAYYYCVEYKYRFAA